MTIDPVTGEFDGYAWGENIGWIHFKNADPAYNVVTEYRAQPPQPPEPVGGIIVPVNRLGLVALASLAALTVALARRRGGI